MSKKEIFLDIGNTSIDILEVESNSINKYSKLYKEEEKEILTYLDKLDYEQVFISSVNKKSEIFITKYFRKKKKNFTLLTRELMKEYVLKNKYNIQNIDILGSDLLCDLVACSEKENYIIFDLGTVSKVMAIDKNKKFLGGLIIPGMTSFSKSINHSTDLKLDEKIMDDLPLLNYETNKCVSSGSVNGLAIMLISIVEKIKEEYNLKDAKVVLTGGNSQFILNALKKYHYESFEFSPKLVLIGLGIIFDRKFVGGENETKKD